MGLLAAYVIIFNETFREENQTQKNNKLNGQEKFPTFSPQHSVKNSLLLFVFIATANSVEAEQKQSGKTTPNNLTHLDQY